MKHTTEPWQASGQMVTAPQSPKRQWGTNNEYSGDFIVVQTYMYVSAEREEANTNAERIVACVNALAGISTDSLQSGVIKRLVDACKDAARTLDIVNAYDASKQLRDVLAELEEKP